MQNFPVAKLKSSGFWVHTPALNPCSTKTQPLPMPPAPSRPYHRTLYSAPALQALTHYQNPPSHFFPTGTAPQQGVMAADPAQPCLQKGKICSIPLHPPAPQAPAAATGIALITVPKVWAGTGRVCLSATRVALCCQRARPFA